MDAQLFPVTITHCPLTSVEAFSHPLCSQCQSGVHIHAQHFSFCGLLFFLVLVTFCRKLTFLSSNLSVFAVSFLKSESENRSIGVVFL